MQAAGPALPELDPTRRQTVSAPVRRKRKRLTGILLLHSDANCYTNQIMAASYTVKGDTFVAEKPQVRIAHTSRRQCDSRPLPVLGPLRD